MTLMRHCERRLMDKIFTDENLLGTWTAFDHVSEICRTSPHKLASQISSAEGQAVTSPVAVHGDDKA